MILEYQRCRTLNAVTMIGPVDELANGAASSILHRDSFSLGASTQRRMLFIVQPECHRHLCMIPI